MSDEPIIRKLTDAERLDRLTQEFALLRVQTDKILEERAYADDLRDLIRRVDRLERDRPTRPIG